jgi:hypothetical protein
LNGFCHAHTNNIPVEVVKEKANKIALKMGIKFQCSNGWLQQFKQRWNITWQDISGESSAADVEASDKWRESVVPLIKQYASQDIFNMDETALFYNAQPKRMLDIKGERCHGGKAYKDRVIMLLCCNGDGSERKMACKNKNVLLLLDQCSAHNHEGLTLKHVHLLHLPANTTSYMQPLDQGIIYCLKRAYLKRLVCFLLQEI